MADDDSGDRAKKAPVEYHEGFLPEHAHVLCTLKAELVWERRGDTPRHEYYCNDYPDPYVYGRGRGRRLYTPSPWHPAIISVRTTLEARTGVAFEMCFLNRYDDDSDHLGWHADDSPEMDDARPIAVVSLGAPREIWFRPKPPALVEAEGDRRDGSTSDRRWHARAGAARRLDPMPTERLLLAGGSLCLMAPGMQETWQHRIPKTSRPCCPRISLTFRGYSRALAG
jgi:alkylated DNA repair dioxygenase AlkB